MDRPADHAEIEAYTTRVSGNPGTPLVLKVSTDDKTFRVAAYRIGAYRGGTGRLVWRSREVPGERQAGPRFQPASTRTVVAPWRPSLTVDTEGWPSGFYVLKLESRSGWDAQVPYIVSSARAAGTVALVAPVATWQAYNVWGGYSLYAGPAGDRRAYAVSFDRPYYGVGGMNNFRTAVIPIVARAEASGVPLSYFANVDLDGRRTVLDGALGYVSMGHDEYWTPSMRRTVTRARDAGSNVALLGANTMYWRVRLSDRATGSDRLMTGYRSEAYLDPEHDSPATTGRFRDAPGVDPENELTGTLYECYPANAPFSVVSPSWWGFQGTGVRAGTDFTGLVGPEADRVYPNRSTPHPLQVLSHSTYSCRGVTTSAQSVYYTTRSGAGVFNVGTLRWGCAMWNVCDVALDQRTSEFVRTVTDNVLREFARGPAGQRHPARDNVRAFGFPLVNSVSAS